MFVTSILIFIGCNNATTDSKSKFIELENITSALLQNKEVNTANPIVEDAQALILRSRLDGYKLIATSDIKQHLNNALIVATIDNKKQIPNAKTFTFAKSITLNDDGSNWNWNADSLGKNIEDFKDILGDDKEKLIIFYDSGEDIFSPAGNAHTGLLWAKHLGYTNVARVIGGLNAWVDNGF